MYHRLPKIVESQRTSEELTQEAEETETRIYNLLNQLEGGFIKNDELSMLKGSVEYLMGTYFEQHEDLEAEMTSMLDDMRRGLITQEELEGMLKIDQHRSGLVSRMAGSLKYQLESLFTRFTGVLKTVYQGNEFPVQQVNTLFTDMNFVLDSVDYITKVIRTPAKKLNLNQVESNLKLQVESAISRAYSSSSNGSLNSPRSKRLSLQETMQELSAMSNGPNTDRSRNSKTTVTSQTNSETGPYQSSKATTKKGVNSKKGHSSTPDKSIVEPVTVVYSNVVKVDGSTQTDTSNVFDIIASPPQLTAKELLEKELSRSANKKLMSVVRLAKGPNQGESQGLGIAETRELVANPRNFEGVEILHVPDLEKQTSQIAKLVSKVKQSGLMQYTNESTTNNQPAALPRPLSRSGKPSSSSTSTSKGSTKPTSSKKKKNLSKGRSVSQSIEISDDEIVDNDKIIKIPLNLLGSKSERNLTRISEITSNSSTPIRRLSLNPSPDTLPDIDPRSMTPERMRDSKLLSTTGILSPFVSKGALSGLSQRPSTSASDGSDSKLGIAHTTLNPLSPTKAGYNHNDNPYRVSTAPLSMQRQAESSKLVPVGLSSVMNNDPLSPYATSQKYQPNESMDDSIEVNYDYSSPSSKILSPLKYNISDKLNLTQISSKDGSFSSKYMSRISDRRHDENNPNINSPSVSDKLERKSISKDHDVNVENEIIKPLRNKINGILIENNQVLLLNYDHFSKKSAKIQDQYISNEKSLGNTILLDQYNEYIKDIHNINLSERTGDSTKMKSIDDFDSLSALEKINSIKSSKHYTPLNKSNRTMFTNDDMERMPSDSLVTSDSMGHDMSRMDEIIRENSIKPENQAHGSPSKQGSHSNNQLDHDKSREKVVYVYDKSQPSRNIPASRSKEDQRGRSIYIYDSKNQEEEDHVDHADKSQGDVLFIVAPSKRDRTTDTSDFDDYVKRSEDLPTSPANKNPRNLMVVNQVKEISSNQGDVSDNFSLNSSISDTISPSSIIFNSPSIQESIHKPNSLDSDLHRRGTSSQIVFDLENKQNMGKSHPQSRRTSAIVYVRADRSEPDAIDTDSKIKLILKKSDNPLMSIYHQYEHDLTDVQRLRLYQAAMTVNEINKKSNETIYKLFHKLLPQMAILHDTAKRSIAVINKAQQISSDLIVLVCAGEGGNDQYKGAAREMFRLLGEVDVAKLWIDLQMLQYRSLFESFLLLNLNSIETLRNNNKEFQHVYDLFILCQGKTVELTNRLKSIRERCHRYNIISETSPPVDLFHGAEMRNHGNMSLLPKSLNQIYQEKEKYEQACNSIVIDMQNKMKDLEEENHELKYELFNAQTNHDQTPAALIFYAALCDKNYISTMQQLVLQLNHLKKFVAGTEHIDFITLRRRLQVCLTTTPVIDRFVFKYDLLHKQWLQHRLKLFSTRNMTGGNADNTLICPICHVSSQDMRITTVAPHVRATSRGGSGTPSNPLSPPYSAARFRTGRLNSSHASSRMRDPTYPNVIIDTESNIQYEGYRADYPVTESDVPSATTQLIEDNNIVESDAQDNQDDPMVEALSSQAGHLRDRSYTDDVRELDLNSQISEPQNILNEVDISASNFSDRDFTQSHDENYDKYHTNTNITTPNELSMEFPVIIPQDRRPVDVSNINEALQDDGRNSVTQSRRNSLDDMTDTTDRRRKSIKLDVNLPAVEFVPLSPGSLLENQD